MKKIFVITMIAVLGILAACDDTADSPELTTQQAEAANNNIFSSVYQEFQTPIAQTTETEYTEADSTSDLFTITGTSGKMDGTTQFQYNFDLKITFNGYQTSSETIQEGSFTFKGYHYYGKVNGELSGKVKFTYDGNPYWDEWDIEVVDDVYSGTFKIKGTTYEFEKDLSKKDE